MLLNKWQEWLVPVLCDITSKYKGWISALGDPYTILKSPANTSRTLPVYSSCTADLLPHTEHCIKKCICIVSFHLIFKLYKALIIYISIMGKLTSTLNLFFHSISGLWLDFLLPCPHQVAHFRRQALVVWRTSLQEPRLVPDAYLLFVIQFSSVGQISEWMPW